MRSMSVIITIPLSGSPRPSPSTISSHVQAFDLYSLSVRLPPHLPPIPTSLSAPAAEHAKSSVDSRFLFRVFLSDDRSRSAMEALPTAIDASGPTGPRHAPTTYHTILSEKCHPCKRAKPASHVGQFSFLPLRDRQYPRLRPVYSPGISFPFIQSV